MYTPKTGARAHAEEGNGATSAAATKSQLRVSHGTTAPVMNVLHTRAVLYIMPLYAE